MAFTALKLEKHMCHVHVLDGSEIHCEVAVLILYNFSQSSPTPERHLSNLTHVFVVILIHRIYVMSFPMLL